MDTVAKQIEEVFMVIIGIDVSKGKSTACFLKPYGEVVYKPFEIQHTDSDMYKLVCKIKSLNQEVKVVLEATGAYHFPVVKYLQKYGIFVSVINPYVMYRYASVAVRRSKTDKLDSIIIAKYGIDDWFSLIDYVPNSEIYDELKLLNNQYNNYITLRVKAKQTLTTLLDRTMHGIKTLLLNRSTEPDRDKLCDFVRKYWHFDNITNMSENAFIKSYNT